MTPFPDCPSDHAAWSAAEKFRSAVDALEVIAIGYSDKQDQAAWHRATGHLQDALAELGFDLRPLKTPAPATAEALFDDAAYSHSRGGM